MSAPRAYRFDRFRLDLARQRLCGEGGETLPVSGRAYDVLLHLLENRDRVVTKDELLKAVWPRMTPFSTSRVLRARSVLRMRWIDSMRSPPRVQNMYYLYFTPWQRFVQAMLHGSRNSQCGR